MDLAADEPEWISQVDAWASDIARPKVRTA